MRPPRPCPLALAVLSVSAFALPSPLRSEEEKAPETVVEVSVAKVVTATLRARVTAYGTVETAPGGPRQAAASARPAAATAGLVTAVPTVEGASVAAGDILVRLDSRAAEAALSKARAGADAAEKNLVRQNRLLKAEGASERSVQEAEEHLAGARADLAAAEVLLASLTVRAPIAGTVLHLDLKPGEWAEAGKAVAEIVDPENLVMNVEVPAAEVAAVRAGQAAAVFSRLGGKELPLASATVGWVSPAVSPGTDSVRVRLSLPARAGLRPGSFLLARIVTEERVGKLAVPRESVHTDGEGHSTLSLVEGDVAHQLAVTTGLADGDLVEVGGEGLKEGATVVTAGSYALPKETKVTVTNTPREASKPEAGENGK